MKLGHHELLEELGRGGMGIVHREALTRALERAPQAWVALANRGVSRGRLGDAAGAADDRGRALAGPPGSTRAREAAAALAAAREALGR